MNPFVPFRPEDIDLIKRYEKLTSNCKKLLSQIFTQVAIDYKILVGRAQQFGEFSGWHFRFGDFRCWLGVCFQSENFLGSRFQVKTNELKPEFVEALKAKGFEEAAAGQETWMVREQSTQAVEVADRVAQVKVFRDVADVNLAIISMIEAQLEPPLEPSVGAGGDIPLKSI